MHIIAGYTEQTASQMKWSNAKRFITLAAVIGDDLVVVFNDNTTRGIPTNSLVSLGSDAPARVVQTPKVQVTEPLNVSFIACAIPEAGVVDEFEPVPVPDDEGPCPAPSESRLDLAEAFEVGLSIREDEDLDDYESPEYEDTGLLDYSEDN
jgi:hypothetical protein